MAVTCKNCGGAHAIWDCKRPATKSTALLKEASAGSVRGKAGREKVAQPEPVRASQAGTQALLVDTNSLPISKANVPTLGIDVGIGGEANLGTPSSTGSERGTSNSEVAGSSPAAFSTNSEPLAHAAAIPQRMGYSPRKDEWTEAPKPKRPRGRPKSITDMASYKRAKQREYRAKWSAIRSRSNTTTERNE